jgi:hypothetical protein
LPTPTFRIGVPYPPIRASTLATFEDVSTVPETTSPLCATGELSDIANIRGGAFGASRTTGGMMVVGANVAIGASGMGVAPALRGSGVDVACVTCAGT